MIFRFQLILVLLVIMISCNKTQKTEEEVLLQYGDRVITMEEVESLIPQGLTRNDSIALFKAIIDSWIKEVVLSDFAEERLYDTRAIDRKVRDYRNSLIVQEYLSRMQESQTPKIEEAKIEEYYSRHRNEMKLEVPLVKGIFIKINKAVEGRDELKKLISTDDPASIDIIEQEWLDQTLEYNYFHDKWIDWDSLSQLLPLRLGNPDNFLKENTFFETEFGDCVYYLKISDYILSGDIQPYEYARTWIANTLTQGALADYERILVNSLVEKAIKENRLKTVGYELK